MENKNQLRISDIKTLDDLNKYKLIMKYQRELKRMEFESSLIVFKMSVSSDNIKRSVAEEIKNYISGHFSGKYMGWLSTFVFSFFKK